MKTSGDILARGGRSATYNVSEGSHNELASNLKIHTPEKVMEMYGIDRASYDELVRKLTAGEELPPIEPADNSEPVVIEDVPVVEEAQTVEELEEEFVPKVGYTGQAVEQNVLIQTVEEGHSGKLVIPKSMRSKTDIGYIRSAGDKVTKFKVGELVLFDNFAAHGREIKLLDEDGVEKEYLLLNEWDIQVKLVKVQMN